MLWIWYRLDLIVYLIRIQTVCYSDSILWKKIEENANFRNRADNILADDKFRSMQRVKDNDDDENYDKDSNWDDDDVDGNFVDD